MGKNSGTGYLASVLRDGARPYLYRGGVCRLLGLPTMEMRAVAPASPPVGFRYAASSRRAEEDL